ncbi:MAG TPA: hypothetical protein VH916_09260 [Dehalococcoidia bacterium]|jgi:alkanesulfonate monooxygenase SsuD/methylene tetrahydromethanopterin reductase-like flavin-dependent oxidoreductase (luciferase family)
MSEHRRDGANGIYEFGLFDWIDRREAPIGRVYEERLQLLEYADTAPFVCYHLAEHHQTPLGLAPSPALFLSSAAQRTRRITWARSSTCCRCMSRCA